MQFRDISVLRTFCCHFVSGNRLYSLIRQIGIYGAYLLCRFRYPVEKEVLFQSFSIVCIYLYFRNFPEKLLTRLLLLIPIAGIIQMLDGLNQFTMPWHNLSHITGIFQNTGLFGGFVALGFICFSFQNQVIGI